MTDAAKNADFTDVPLPKELIGAIEKFRQWAVNHLQAEQDATTITEPLYHYTDRNGLKGILEHGRMWFTDYRHLNDPSELKHGIDMAHDCARMIANGADGRLRLMLDCFRDMFTHENFDTALEFYISCFSRARDDLDQWRNYADNGRGFAVGFAPRMFKIVEASPDRPPEFLGPVRYTLDEVHERHNAALDQASNIFLEAVSANAELMTNKPIGISFIRAFAREMIAQPLIWNSLTSKHPAYLHEQEVRLVILGTPARLSPYVTTRIRGSETVPYISHPMPIREPDHIVEILIGPAAPADAEKDLRKLLDSIGIENRVEISRSDIPYRAM